MNQKKVRLILIILIVLQVIAALYFCTVKQGYHYDENYSYYSSNVTAGLTPTDNAWMDTDEIADEFMVLPGEGFNYGMVKLMQSYDVHPPMYYWILHTVCSITAGSFSKWQGLSVNLLFYVLSIIMLWFITDVVSEHNNIVKLATVAIYGLSPAVLSGVTFIRMYMMLTFLCFLSFYIHLRGLQAAKRSWKFYLLVFVTTYVGFMTHYYYIVFLFFAAAYMSIYLFVRRETRGEAFIYAGCVLGGMALELITYPACLGHIFRGYRGTEAIDAALDAGNIGDRLEMFVGLLDDYVLSYTFYLVVLLVLIGLITYGRLRQGIKQEITDAVRLHRHIIWFCIIVVAGYFLVVMKTALMQAEEAVRYEMPIYGLLIMLLIYGLVYYGSNIASEKAGRAGQIAAIVVIGIMLAGNIAGLINGRVLFLYQEDAQSYEWASDRSDTDVIYIYNDANSWMIWDDAHELMEYNRIFFIDMNNEDEITDDDINSDNNLLVYAVRSDEATSRLHNILKNNSNLTTITKVRELKYADVYELR